MVALAHGTNDAQKTMGVICLALIANGNLSSTNFHVPDWVVVLLRAGDRARHLHGRLADHQDTRHQGHRGPPAAGVLIGGGRRRRDPRLLAPRLPALHDPGRLRRGHWLRRRPAGRAGRLDRRAADRVRLAAHAARGGPPPRSSTGSRICWAAARSGRSRSTVILAIACFALWRANKASGVDPEDLAPPSRSSEPEPTRLPHWRRWGHEPARRRDRRLGRAAGTWRSSRPSSASRSRSRSESARRLAARPGPRRGQRACAQRGDRDLGRARRASRCWSACTSWLISSFYGAGLRRTASVRFPHDRRTWGT